VVGFGKGKDGCRLIGGLAVAPGSCRVEGDLKDLVRDLRVGWGRSRHEKLTTDEHG
jgi:hypothetical protein